MRRNRSQLGNEYFIHTEMFLLSRDNLERLLRYKRLAGSQYVSYKKKPPFL